MVNDKVDAYPFKDDTYYENIGYCWSVSGDFITMVHVTPCTAHIANAMQMNGYEIYTQPTAILYPKLREDRDTFVVTYRKIENVN